jgi:hypothetical protein
MGGAADRGNPVTVNPKKRGSEQPKMKTGWRGTCPQEEIDTGGKWKAEQEPATGGKNEGKQRPWAHRENREPSFHRQWLIRDWHKQIKPQKLIREEELKAQNRSYRATQN